MGKKFTSCLIVIGLIVPLIAIAEPGAAGWLTTTGKTQGSAVAKIIELIALLGALGFGAAGLFKLNSQQQGDKGKAFTMLLVAGGLASLGLIVSLSSGTLSGTDEGSTNVKNLLGSMNIQHSSPDHINPFRPIV